MTLAALVLAGCGGSRSVEQQRSSSQLASAAPAAAPLSLTRTSEQSTSVLMPLDEKEIRRAISNYAVNKQRDGSDYRLTGADLNGDGTPEALVLFQGKDWCVPTGCSLAVFKAGPRGYRAAFRTVRVKPPVIVTRAASNGWRHLLVTSGGAGSAPLRRVLLRFGEKGYPRNAMLEPEVPGRAEVEGEVAIEAAPAAGTAQATSSR